MRYICLFVILLPFVTPEVVRYRPNLRTDVFGIFKSVGSFFGLSNFSELLRSIGNLFNIVTSRGYEKDASVSLPEDAYLNITQLVTKYGYIIEEHKVTTEDGYILTLHRIPGGRYGKQKGVVFLMHGLVDSSDSWILQGPDYAIGYVLADAGYDVWMGNARGNKYSPDHITLTNKDKMYWKFSWEEIGLYDLPATIDYILNLTTEQDLYYIGHSQGTTTFYVMTSMRPEYNRKIKIMFSLSPTAYMSNIKSPLVRMFAPAHYMFAQWLSNFNIYAPSSEYINKLLSVLCYVIKCDNVLNLIAGPSGENVDKAVLPVVLAHMPTTASTLQLIHYGQLFESGRFCRYDYGERTNQLVYNTNRPPSYHLSKITVPIVLFYGSKDWLSDRIDVEILMSELPKVYSHYYIENFNHIDFLYTSTAKDIIYERIIEIINGNIDTDSINISIDTEK